MKAPQITLIMLVVIGLTIHLVKHGEDRSDEYHFGWKLLSDLILIGILYWGGFFS